MHSELLVEFAPTMMKSAVHWLHVDPAYPVKQSQVPLTEVPVLNTR
jgi:hypothetical protein